MSGEQIDHANSKSSELDGMDECRTRTPEEDARLKSQNDELRKQIAILSEINFMLKTTNMSLRIQCGKTKAINDPNPDITIPQYELENRKSQDIPATVTVTNTTGGNRQFVRNKKKNVKSDVDGVEIEKNESISDTTKKDGDIFVIDSTVGNRQFVRNKKKKGQVHEEASSAKKIEDDIEIKMETETNTREGDVVVINSTVGNRQFVRKKKKIDICVDEGFPSKKIKKENEMEPENVCNSPFTEVVINKDVESVDDTTKELKEKIMELKEIGNLNSVQMDQMGPGMTNKCDVNDEKENDFVKEEIEQNSDRNVLLQYIKIDDTDVKKIVFRCTLCERFSNDKAKMKMHVESMHFPGTFSYPCKYCSSILITKAAYRGHVRFHHKEKITKRGITETNDGEKVDFSYYVKRDNTNPDAVVFRCTECDFKGVKKWNVRCHVESIHFRGSFSYSCKHCKKKVATKGGLHTHETKCRKLISALENSETELPSKEVEKSLKFFKAESSCDGDTPSQDVLYENIEVIEPIDSKVPVYRCRICDKRCGRKDNMRSHVESAHFADSFMYWCQVCLNTFKTRTALYKHVWKHHKDTIKTKGKRRSEWEEYIERDDTDPEYRDVPIFRCKLCDVTSARKDRIRKHVGAVHFPSRVKSRKRPALISDRSPA